MEVSQEFESLLTNRTKKAEEDRQRIKLAKENIATQAR